MPIEHWNQEWLNANSQRRYPLADSASGADTGQAFALPDSLLLELSLPVSAGLEVRPEKFFLQKLALSDVGLSLTVGYDDGTITAGVAGVRAALAVVSLADHAEYDSYTLVGQDDFQDSVGKLVLGRLDELRRLAAGRYLFLPSATPLEIDCFRPQLRGLSALVVVNGNERSERLTGDVELVSGPNCLLSLSQVDGSPPRIRIDALDGSGLTEECGCVQTTTPIKTINGLPPDPSGDFVFEGKDCIEVAGASSGAGGGLSFTDTCARPCCGCPELEVITQALQRLEQGAASLEGFYSRLEGQVTQMNVVVLGSRLNEPTCQE